MKRIVFLTATRAEYGKIKPILKLLHESQQFQLDIFVTGMHMLEKFGYTFKEIVKDGYGNIVMDEEYAYDARMDVSIARVIRSFGFFVRQSKPDMIVVHGDRLDAMAGAIVGAFNNIFVAHIEGGEVSGTIDESIRHSVSKLSHFHFVANEEAQKRLIQLGEPAQNIFAIGSPDIDVMLSDNLPHLEEVFERYNITYNNYAILLYHPVVTEVELISEYISTILSALRDTPQNYVVIYPNNDPGNEAIRRAYEQLAGHDCFHILPSMRFEYFLTLLKNADFIIGNSSAGIREACVYATPAIDIGSRQRARYSPDVLRHVLHVNHNASEIQDAVARKDSCAIKSLHFGSGGSAESFCRILLKDIDWKEAKQKCFVDIEAL